jgi:trimeric autotransporter adhesin
MWSRLRRPSPAMIVALIALFVATAGAGVAATAIDGRNLKNRSVSTPKLQIGSVRSAQLATGAVTTTKLKAKAVTAGKVAVGAIGTDQLAAGAVRAADIGAAAIGTPQIAAGAVGNAALANGAVSEGKMANGAVTRAKLAADAQLPALAVRRSAPVDVPNGTVGSATASCQPGERATGGGALASCLPADRAHLRAGRRPGAQRGRRRPDRLGGLPVQRRHGHPAADRLRDLRPGRLTRLAARRPRV